eukprot:scaffold22710_cov114-Cylindrotheca_fusiformis.AAC.1
MLTGEEGAIFIEHQWARRKKLVLPQELRKVLLDNPGTNDPTIDISFPKKSLSLAIISLCHKNHIQPQRERIISLSSSHHNEEKLYHEFQKESSLSAV